MVGDSVSEGKGEDGRVVSCSRSAGGCWSGQEFSISLDRARFISLAMFGDVLSREVLLLFNEEQVGWMEAQEVLYSDKGVKQPIIARLLSDYVGL